MSTRTDNTPLARESTWLAAGFVAVVVAYASLSGVWTDTSSSWYDDLDKPWFQPPGVVFGIIWPLNFLALGVVGVLLALKHPGVARRALAVFAVSVVFALGWAYLFNQARELWLSAGALVVAAVLTWVLLAVVARARAAYALGLVVYAGWMTLAATLSVSIAVIN